MAIGFEVFDSHEQFPLLVPVFDGKINYHFTPDTGATLEVQVPIDPQPGGDMLEPQMTTLSVPIDLTLPEVWDVARMISSDPLLKVTTPIHQDLGNSRLVIHTMGNIAGLLDNFTDPDLWERVRATPDLLRSCLEKINIVGLINRLCSQVIEGESATFSYEHAQKIMEMMLKRENVVAEFDGFTGPTSPERVLHIFELVNNAVAAGGAKKIEVGRYDVLQGDRLMEIITVTDDGIGILPRYAREMFKPGRTFRKGGTGQGLDLIRQYAIERHKGGVTVQTSTSEELALRNYQVSPGGVRLSSWSLLPRKDAWHGTRFSVTVPKLAA